MQWRVSRTVKYWLQLAGLVIAISHTRSVGLSADFNVLFLRNRYYLRRYVTRCGSLRLVLIVKDRVLI